MMTRVKLPVLGFALAWGAFSQTPNVAENGVLNSASYSVAGQPGFAVSPGSLVAIFGENLAGQLTQASSVPLSVQLSDVSVQFNDTLAPLQFVSPTQVNAQLPWSLLTANQEAGTATVIVTRGGNRSQPRQVQLGRFSPGIYSLSGTGTGAAFVLNASDGSFTQPAGSVTGFASRPARSREALIIYASGLGPVDSPVADGAASLDRLRNTVTKATVLIGGREAEVPFSGLAPQFPGVNQVNAIVPEGIPAGNAVPIQIRIGGITTTDQLTIAVQN